MYSVPPTLQVLGHLYVSECTVSVLVNRQVPSKVFVPRIRMKRTTLNDVTTPVTPESLTRFWGEVLRDHRREERTTQRRALLPRPSLAHSARKLSFLIDNRHAAERATNLPHLTCVRLGQLPPASLGRHVALLETHTTTMRLSGPNLESRGGLTRNASVFFGPTRTWYSG